MLHPDQITRLLVEQFGARVDGSTYRVEDDRRLTLLIQHTQGIMQLPRVLELTFEADLVRVLTEEELYFVPAQSLFGLKAANPARDRDEHRPGFRR